MRGARYWVRYGGPALAPIQVFRRLPDGRWQSRSAGEWVDVPGENLARYVEEPTTVDEITEARALAYGF